MRVALSANSRMRWRQAPRRTLAGVMHRRFASADPRHVRELRSTLEASAARLAGSHRVFLVTNVFPNDAGGLSGYGYRMVQHRLFAGMGGTEVSIYTSRPLPR